MAQASAYNIPNESGAQFRSDLNTLLAAIASHNSGSTAPTTTYAYMLWVDTSQSPPLLKLRNGANSGWITVGDVTATNLGLATLASPTFTGTVTIPAGASISGYLSTATASSTYAPLASPTFTGTVTIPAGASISGYLPTATAASTYAPLASPTFTGTVTIPAGASISGYAALASAQSFTAAQRGSITALTDGATITPDFATANNFSITLGGNRTLANPTNLTAGQSGSIVITNGGSYTLAFGAYWKFPGGTAPSLTASGVDVLAYYVDSSTRITARLISDVK